ncbi:uncharacterized protein Z518_05435 [Rhinocladiella mackenziei CBS 650.93]|uniref:NAD-dependent epimerase/dehydratase domain-containing protein n=1 Tax=Rhinocladiella mackenziei CBS 650.93 TaxID=1442369 RepID=A0A0D2J699_9EURO|nr:uncharacterized protein Z518_05435 [Rhinocladiella mackenziei CBS 650.93]KIX04565.1 hypothetical protein Z518_05435 [Rhinocladiella mackenziei CBS 650.93]
MYRCVFASATAEAYSMRSGSYKTRTASRHGKSCSVFYCHPILDRLNQLVAFSSNFVSENDRKGTGPVTGGNGFVAMHIIRELIEHGYSVIATGRSMSKAEDVYTMYPDWKPLYFECVPDIGTEDVLQEIFKKYHDRSQYIIHTASPVNFAAKDIQKELIDPAVQGVSNILKDAHEYGGSSIKRFVLLASAVTVLNLFEDMSVAGKPYTEYDWNPIYAVSASSPMLGYIAAKTLAEKAAWEFVSTTKPSFGLTTINPDIVVGPPLRKLSKPTALNETNMIAVYNFLNGTYKRIEDVMLLFYYFVDIRDVSSATVAATTTLSASGNRILLVEDELSPQLVKNIIEKDFPQLKDQLPLGGNLAQKFPSGIYPTGWDVSRSSAILADWEGLNGKKWRHHDLETSVVDTVKKILQLEEEWANRI